MASWDFSVVRVSQQGSCRWGRTWVKWLMGTGGSSPGSQHTFCVIDGATVEPWRRARFQPTHLKPQKPQRIREVGRRPLIDPPAGSGGETPGA
jgi:hypothetical protein